MYFAQQSAYFLPNLMAMSPLDVETFDVPTVENPLFPDMARISTVNGDIANLIGQVDRPQPVSPSFAIRLPPALTPRKF